jgi:hypothetical protein
MTANAPDSAMLAQNCHDQAVLGEWRIRQRGWVAIAAAAISCCGVMTAGAGVGADTAPDVVALL